MLRFSHQLFKWQIINNMAKHPFVALVEYKFINTNKTSDQMYYFQMATKNRNEDVYDRVCPWYVHMK